MLAWFRAEAACFAAEAFERLRVLSYVLGQKLQSDKASEFNVLSFVDHSHPAPPPSFSTMRDNAFS